MNKNWSKFVVSAMVAGFISSHVALADDGAAPAGDEAGKTKENGCGGEKGCSGKCKGKAKKHKKHKKAKGAAAEAPAAEAPAAEAPAPEAK